MSGMSSRRDATEDLQRAVQAIVDLVDSGELTVAPSQVGRLRAYLAGVETIAHGQRPLRNDLRDLLARAEAESEVEAESEAPATRRLAAYLTGAIAALEATKSDEPGMR